MKYFILFLFILCITLFILYLTYKPYVKREGFEVFDFTKDNKYNLLAVQFNNSTDLNVNLNEKIKVEENMNPILNNMLDLVKNNNTPLDTIAQIYSHLVYVNIPLLKKALFESFIKIRNDIYKIFVDKLESVVFNIIYTNDVRYTELRIPSPYASLTIDQLLVEENRIVDIFKLFPISGFENYITQLIVDSTSNIRRICIKMQYEILLVVSSKISVLLVPTISLDDLVNYVIILTKLQKSMNITNAPKESTEVITNIVNRVTDKTTIVIDKVKNHTINNFSETCTEYVNTIKILNKFPTIPIRSTLVYTQSRLNSTAAIISSNIATEITSNSLNTESAIARLNSYKALVIDFSLFFYESKPIIKKIEPLISKDITNTSSIQDAMNMLNSFKTVTLNSSHFTTEYNKIIGVIAQKGLNDITNASNIKDAIDIFAVFKEATKEYTNNTTRISEKTIFYSAYKNMADIIESKVLNYITNASIQDAINMLKSFKEVTNDIVAIPTAGPTAGPTLAPVIQFNASYKNMADIIKTKVISYIGTDFVSANDKLNAFSEATKNEPLFADKTTIQTAIVNIGLTVANKIVSDITYYKPTLVNAGNEFNEFIKNAQPSTLYKTHIDIIRNGIYNKITQIGDLLIGINGISTIEFTKAVDMFENVYELLFMINGLIVIDDNTPLSVLTKEKSDKFTLDIERIKDGLINIMKKDRNLEKWKNAYPVISKYDRLYKDVLRRVILEEIYNSKLKNPNISIEEGLNWVNYIKETLYGPNGISMARHNIYASFELWIKQANQSLKDMGRSQLYIGGENTYPGYTPPAETTPAYTTPAYTTPAYTTPAETTPAYTTPAYTTPAYTTPAYTTPAYTTPAYTTPAYTTPAYTTPAETTPAYTTPAYTTPAYTTPAETTPAYTTPAYTTPAYTTPAYTTPAYTTPAYTTPAYTTPAYTTPAYTTPAYTTPAETTPAYTTPAYTTPAYTTPAETTPAYTTPAYTTPAYTTPAYTTPAYTTPAYTTPAYTTPAYTTPAYTTPAYTTPAYTTPAYTTPAETTPAYTTPAYTTPAETTPAYTTPAETTPAYTTPVYTTPAYTTPAYTTPAETTPAWTTPAYTTPAETTPAYTTPAWTTPAYTTPAYTTPAYTTPAETTPAYTTPAYTTPAYTTPAWTTPAYTTPAYTTPAWTTPTWTTSASSTGYESSSTRTSTTPKWTSYTSNVARPTMMNNIYLKDDTNTTYDKYLGNVVLKSGDSASSYMMRHPSYPKYPDIHNKLIEHNTLIDFFKKAFETYSKS